MSIAKTLRSWHLEYNLNRVMDSHVEIPEEHIGLRIISLQTLGIDMRGLEQAARAGHYTAAMSNRVMRRFNKLVDALEYYRATH